MKVETFNYSSENGWSVKNFPNLDSKNTLIFVFESLSVNKDSGPLKELAKHYPNSQMIGCSTVGEISEENLCDNSMTVSVIQFANTPFKVIKESYETTSDMTEVGKKVIQQLQADDLKGIIAFYTIHPQFSNLIDGIKLTAHKDVIITGGMAGFVDKNYTNWALLNGEIVTNCVVAVGLYGNAINMNFSANSGLDIFGPERIITRSEGNVLFELDNKPALPLYKEYLGKLADGLPDAGVSFPLSIRENETSEPLIRLVMGIDEKEQSIIFGGNLPVGYTAQLMRASIPHLIEGAGNAVTNVFNKVKGVNNEQQTLSLAISCHGRRLALGEHTEEEVQKMYDLTPKNVKQMGLYALGNISPNKMGQTVHHNQTLVMTTFSEKEAS